MERSEAAYLWGVGVLLPYLVLQRCDQECAYVCNMAVAPEHRRRGYGLLLLEAAEEVARLGGQRDVYLHLRLASKLWFLCNPIFCH